MSKAVRCPIARYIFFVFFQLGLFFQLPPSGLAQVTPDNFMPFSQGQVIEVPSTTEYLGDLPEEIGLSIDPVPFRTISGLMAEQVGWVGSGTPFSLGPNNGSPALLFEGVPYPFQSSKILTWFPTNGQIEFLNFPASAWWGPGASTGSIQIQAPLYMDKSQTGFFAGGGSGGTLDEEERYENPSFSIAGNVQHGFLSGATSSDTFSLLSKADWIGEDRFKLQSGFLGSQWFGGDNWYSFFSSLQWNSPNFQSIEVKPFLQTAQLDGLNLWQAGTQVNYHFNMAGLAESQLGMGASRSELSPSLGGGNLDELYLQNTEQLDIIGSMTANMAFRVDFSNSSSTDFSTILGVQGKLDNVTLFGSYSKGVDQSLTEDAQQLEGGIQFQPDDHWLATCRYVYDQLGPQSWNGGRIKLQWNRDSTMLWIIHQLRIEIETLALQDQQGYGFFDTGGKIGWNISREWALWLQGRGISRGDFYVEVGTDYAFTEHIKGYLSVSNINNQPFSWPDLTSLQGRVFWCGVQGQF